VPGVHGAAAVLRSQGVARGQPLASGVAIKLFGRLRVARAGAARGTPECRSGLLVTELIVVPGGALGLLDRPYRPQAAANGGRAGGAPSPAAFQEELVTASGSANSPPLVLYSFVSCLFVFMSQQHSPSFFFRGNSKGLPGEWVFKAAVVLAPSLSSTPPVAMSMHTCLTLCPFIYLFFSCLSLQPAIYVQWTSPLRRFLYPGPLVAQETAPQSKSGRVCRSRSSNNTNSRSCTDRARGERPEQQRRAQS
jgi:hypothetical protein